MTQDSWLLLSLAEITMWRRELRLTQDPKYRRDLKRKIWKLLDAMTARTAGRMAA